MIVDLHCDLLSHPSFLDSDSSVRCSPNQLIEGGVHTQVCAMFTQDAYGAPSLDEQNHLFFSLPKSDSRLSLLDFQPSHLKQKPVLSLVRSIENASGLGSDSQDLHVIFEKLVSLFSMGPIAYIGLVWNGRNRFGGGVLDPYPLTTEGKRLLEVMHYLSIPVDVSHCSDRLVDGILDYRADKLPTMKVIASHSNFRSVVPIPRNLLDVHAKEIAKEGVIGLNSVSYFVGTKLEDIRKHIQHAQHLGILDSLALGTDFFYSEEDKKFFTCCATAKSHPHLHRIIRDSVSAGEAQRILGESAHTFLEQVLHMQKDTTNLNAIL